jgi:hypothetical protein
MSQTTNKILILLNTEAYSLNLNQWNNAEMNLSTQFKIESVNQSTPRSYAYRRITGVEKAFCQTIDFPRANIHGDVAKLNLLKQLFKKYYEFTDITFTDSVQAFESFQTPGYFKAHVQIAPFINPDASLVSTGSKGYQYFLATTYYRPVTAMDNTVVLDQNGNFGWTERGYYGLTIGAFIQGLTANTGYVTKRPIIVLMEDRGRFIRSVPVTGNIYPGNFQTDPAFNVQTLAETLAHEIGHTFGLDHWNNTNTLYNHTGNNTWKPTMGVFPMTINQADFNRFTHWSRGDNPTEYQQYFPFVIQDDFRAFLSANILNKIVGNNFISIMMKSILDSGVNIWKFKHYKEKILSENNINNLRRFNNPFIMRDEAEQKLSIRKSRLINILDIRAKDGLKTIEGLIGFPNDSDILKIILKEGTYEISEYPNSPGDKKTKLHLGLDIVKSKLEISKSQLDKQENEIYNKTLMYPIDADPDSEISNLRETFQCFDEALAKVYPEGAEEGCSFLKWPASQVYSRPAEAAGSTGILNNDSTAGQFNTFRRVNNGTIQVKKTCMIYLIAFGDKHPDPTTGFSSYGSIGKYFLTIRKNGNNADLNQLLPGAVPPNCYPTEKLKCVMNGAVEDKIFFTQDPEDYANNAVYDNVSDHPNAKKYHVVVNGKLLEKIPFLLQGKEYGLNDTIDERDKKELFAVSSQVSPDIGKSKIQEFIVAPEWDY